MCRDEKYVPIAGKHEFKEVAGIHSEYGPPVGGDVELIPEQCLLNPFDRLKIRSKHDVMGLPYPAIFL